MKFPWKNLQNSSRSNVFKNSLCSSFLQISLYIFPKNRVNIGDIASLLTAIVKLIKSTIKEKEIIILESISLFSLRVEADKGQSERIESPRASCRTNSIQRQAAVNGDSSVDEASTPMDVDVGQGRPDSQPCCFYATCQ